MSLFNRIANWLCHAVALPTEQDIVTQMEKQPPKFPPIESFRISLRWSLRFAIRMDPLSTIRRKVYVCEVETECLTSAGEEVPDWMDMFFDLEISPGEYKRLWFEMRRRDEPGTEFDKFGNEIAVYNAFCDRR